MQTASVNLRIKTPVNSGRFDDWREAFGRAFLRLNIEPQGEMFETRISLRALPNLSLGRVSTTACRLVRTRELLADGRDDIGLVVLLRGAAQVAEEGGRTVEVRQGQAVFLRNSARGGIAYSDDTRHLCFTLPREALAPYCPDIDASCMSPVDGHEAPVKLLSDYARLVVSDPELTQGAVGSTVRHLQDLAAILMTRSPETYAATGRGARAAAHMAAIKAMVMNELTQGGLTAASVAKALGITPRYVSKLFEAEGATFTGFVLEQRLRRARHLLEDEALSPLKISDVALASGFGDISYFNKCFRRRFSMTPSDARVLAGMDRLDGSAQGRRPV